MSVCKTWFESEVFPMPGVLNSFKLDGKVAVVTGASRGLGAAMAGALAEAGADVALVARGGMAPTEALLAPTGRRFLSLTADLKDRSQTGRIIRDVCDGLGEPDILVNNAGTIRRCDFLDFPAEDWDEVMEVNLSSIFLLCQDFSKLLVQSGKPGKIINIASLLSYQGGIRVASYTASKSALQGLTRIMANELAPHGINVNAIAPGYMATDNTQALRDDPERNQAILERIPAGRWGRADDLNGAVVFLASAASDYMQGITMAVDGGWLAR